MLPSQSPFPCQWWGTSLGDVGLDDVRPDAGTYGRYEFGALPPLPFDMRGDFDWLTSAAEHQEPSIGEEARAENAQSLVQLCKESAALHIKLPDAFIRFMGSPELQKKIRSNTDCFLNLCPALVRSPIGDGYLVRFLADSQGCIFWYLYLPADGTDHAVVSSSEFYGTAAEQWEDEPSTSTEIVYNAEDFETFICRFWLENEIWFAGWSKQPMPDAGRQYIESYKRGGQ